MAKLLKIQDISFWKPKTVVAEQQSSDRQRDLLELERGLKEKGMDFSGQKALRHLKMLGIAVMDIGGELYAYVTKPTRRHQEIFNSLKIKSPPRFIMETDSNS